MANTLYDTAREGFLKGEIDWLNDTIKLVDHIAQLHRKPCLENDFEKAIYFFALVAEHMYWSRLPAMRRSGARSSHDLTVRV